MSYSSIHAPNLSELCLAVSPGYEQFPARCVKFLGHVGCHEAAVSRLGVVSFKATQWPNEDAPFTSEE